jgi:predicted dehydrogenase
MTNVHQPLRVAVVGCGIGASHVRAYKTLEAQFALTTICDIDEAKARALAEEHGVPRVVGDFAELCRMDDLDVIDICTPPHLHFAQIRQALAAGKHAICEKPLVGSLKEADELVADETASGRRLMPIFQYRFGHGLQKLRFLQAEGLTGTPYQATIETAWRRRAEYYAVPWRGKWATELGGALLGHAIHAHDLLCYVLGPVRSVFARVATRVNAIEVEDTAAVALEMASGALASLSLTLGSAAEISRHRFTFQNLSTESNTRPYTASGDPWTFTGDSPELAARIEEELARFTPLPESYAGQFYRFAEALHTGGELPVTLADARASLELITAMYHSAQTGQPVELPIGPDHPKYASWLP